MRKVSDEFVVGKNNIGYIASDFTKEFSGEELTDGKVLKFDTLPRDMSDSEIISEFKVQECTLGDVLETIKNTPETLKDGSSNIFYIKGHPSRVVDVSWLGGGWHVFDWFRAFFWGGGDRVFSPATSGTETLNPSSASSLTLSKYCECKTCEHCGKIIKVIPLY